MHPMLNTAIKAARRGAAVINRASFDLDRVIVNEKQHNDFVTDVDTAAEQAIIEVLSKAYPEHGFLAEESGASANVNDETEYLWIIDPLDGTTNFMHGSPVRHFHRPAAPRRDHAGPGVRSGPQRPVHR